MFATTVRQLKQLFLIRGLPGSGKTELARALVKRPTHQVSANQFFYDQDGQFRYKPALVLESHADCLRRLETLMQPQEYIGSPSELAVSNVFAECKDMEPYVRLANAYDYRVTVLEVQNPLRNSTTHNVPEEYIRRYMDRWASRRDVYEMLSRLSVYNTDYLPE